MPRCRGSLCLAAILVLFTCVRDQCFALSPSRYTMLDRGRVVDVFSANIMTLKLLDSDKVIAVRLLGVGSPRNRDRVKNLAPQVLHHIQENHLWEASRHYVAGLLKNQIVEIWIRKWDALDDKHRLLAYLLVPSESEGKIDVNAEIIRNGMGFVTRDYLHVTFAAYRKLEEKARTDRRGVWQGLPYQQASLATEGRSE